MLVNLVGFHLKTTFLDNSLRRFIESGDVPKYNGSQVSTCRDSAQSLCFFIFNTPLI